MQSKKSIQTQGGLARAKSLSSERRSAIAKKAATDRWTADLPVASHEGKLPIGKSVVSCAVLENGERVITQSTFLLAIGRARTTRSGTGINSTGDQLPIFLQNKGFKPFILEETLLASKPILYRTKSGGKGMGYSAALLPAVAEVYLRFRDEILATKGSVPTSFQNYVKAADILIRGLANVGIIALVDEATGYQKDRAKDDLAKILEQFIAKELRPWVKSFPDEFYEQLFRLRGLHYPTYKVQRPQYFGRLTNDIIYARLAPGVLDELKKITPKDDKGRLKNHLHRRLTDEMGHPKLRELLASVVTLMKISKNYDGFHEILEQIHPRFNTQMRLPYESVKLNGKL